MADHKIVAERRTSKRMSDDLVRSQMQHCADIAMKGGRGRGWTYKLGRIPEPMKRGAEVVHTATLNFSTTSARESLDDKWPNIVRRFAEAACAGNLRAQPWRVIEPTGFAKIADEAKAEQLKASELKELANEPKELAEINLTPGAHFERIYGREAQIRRTFDALKLAHRTGFNKRRNTLYDGPPGCGKSETMLSFAKMLGREGEQWLWFDAPNMTKAGAIELLISASKVPPILFIEEIEKVEEAALRWLLGVMDIRGEVRRTNYRVGNEAKNVRLLVIASANNVKLLKSVMSGALYSRFQNRIFFPEPDRNIMSQILTREVKEIEGDGRWVEPALKFGFDRWGMRDPRDIINIATCGGARLLDGSAQKDHEATMHPFDKVSLYRAKKRREKQGQKLERMMQELQELETV
jgi:hypothetical protein